MDKRRNERRKKKVGNSKVIDLGFKINIISETGQGKCFIN